jgi:hypothetical protein
MLIQNASDKNPLFVHDRLDNRSVVEPLKLTAAAGPGPVAGAAAPLC